MPPPIGVLLMAYGGPDSLDDIAGYLADIRSGRPTPQAVVEEIRHNYEQIGGRSPLLAITHRQAAAVEARLNAAAPRYRVYVGMRHWRPWLEETVRDMLEAGLERAVAIVLAPHYSSLSVARYQARLTAGLALYHGQLEIAYVDSYHTAPLYIAALVERVQAGLARWPSAEQATVHVIFSAHSLPTRILDQGDPYQQQLFETARLVAAGAGLTDDRWSWSYQSAGRSPEPWLGPQLEEHLPVLAERGIQRVVSLPIGFVCDHVEVLYDIDIKAQAVAHQLGLRLERPPSLNDDPRYIETLARLVEERSAAWLPSPEIAR